MFLLEYDSYDHSPRSYPYGCLLEELCPNLPFFFFAFLFRKLHVDGCGMSYSEV